MSNKNRIRHLQREAAQRGLTWWQETVRALSKEERQDLANERKAARQRALEDLRNGVAIGSRSEPMPPIHKAKVQRRGKPKKSKQLQLPTAPVQVLPAAELPLLASEEEFAASLCEAQRTGRTRFTLESLSACLE